LFTTAVGAWGDVIASYGNMVELLREKQLKSCDVIYLGRDDKIKDFLKIQDIVDNVLYIKPHENQYVEIAHAATHEQFDWSAYSKGKKVIETHITEDYLQGKKRKYNRFLCKLPTSKCIESDKRKLIVQPFSTHSVSPIEHWAFWFNAIEWVSERDWEVIVVGQKNGGLRGRGFKFPDLSLLSVTDMVGKTASMTDIFALVNDCDAVLTTSNCLSMWSIISNTPALVICNKLNITHDYYHNWIDHEPNTILKTNICFETFKKRFIEWESKA